MTPAPREAFLGGMAAELSRMSRRYAEDAAAQSRLEARIAAGERRIAAARRHLEIALEGWPPGAVPAAWSELAASARFAGAAAGDACVLLLRERGPLATEELRTLLAAAGFRFRTRTPGREIHAALLRKRGVGRSGGRWIPDEERSER